MFKKLKTVLWQRVSLAPTQGLWRRLFFCCAYIMLFGAFVVIATGMFAIPIYGFGPFPEYVNRIFAFGYVTVFVAGGTGISIGLISTAVRKNHQTPL